MSHTPPNTQLDPKQETITYTDSEEGFSEDKPQSSLMIWLNNMDGHGSSIINNKSNKNDKKIHEIKITGYASSNFPIIKKKDVTLFFQGEIKNYHKLYKVNCYEEHSPKENTPYSDSTITNMELIIDLYLLYGFEYTIQLLEGDFFLILLDNNLNIPESILFVGCDKWGLCPLYTVKTKEESHIVGFTSSLALLEKKMNFVVEPFASGTYSHYTLSFKVLSIWKQQFTNVSYFMGYPKQIFNIQSRLLKQSKLLKSIEIVQTALIESIEFDVGNLQLTSPSPVACLVSGGICSSVLLGLLRDYYFKHNLDISNLQAFTVGFRDSEDLKYAKIIAKYYNIQLTEIVLTENTYMEMVPMVISILGTYDVATIRYGVHLYVLIKHIHGTTHIRNVFTGDGGNEMMGGYLNFKYMKTSVECDYECNQLLKTYSTTGALYKKLFDHFHMRLHRPFLNDVFISNYMSICMNIRFANEFEKFTWEIKEDETTVRKMSICDMDKELFRMAFSPKYYKTYKFEELVPHEILYRSSEPCYDGISSYYRPFWQIMLINLPVNASREFDGYEEYQHYKKCYEKYFPNVENRILDKIPPYKYAASNYDPTMRKLDIYLDFHMEYQDRSL